jgi:hypothetical protein
MADVEYGVYENNGSTDGTAVATESISNALRDDEWAARIAQLFLRTADANARTTGRNWVIKPTSEAV